MTPCVEVSCTFRYEAAHWLPNVPADHQCRRMHGHSYCLTVTVRGPIRANGFVIDFADIKAAVNPVVARLDHQTLNEVGLPNPTVENQLVWLWHEISIDLLSLHELRLQETATNSATYRGETE